MGRPVSRASLVLFFVLASAALPQSRRRETQEAPEGEGRTVLLEACVQCHDLRIVAAQRKTQAAWKRTVHEMIWKGAPVLADEVDVLAKYLAASFGTGTKTGGSKQ